MVKKETTLSPYVRDLQRGINSDIQLVKAGALDEEGLRVRLSTINDPNEPAVLVSLWLAGLSMNLYDDLEIIVKEGPNGPAYVFKPSWTSARMQNAPVLEFNVPGPQAEQTPGPAPVLSIRNQPLAAEN